MIKNWGPWAPNIDDQGHTDDQGHMDDQGHIMLQKTVKNHVKKSWFSNGKYHKHSILSTNIDFEP